MKDTISRQAAIDDLHEKDPSQIWDTADVEVWINELPSAQPDIIRCKYCMHNGSFDTDCPIDWAGKDYCSFAERRTDEQT